MADFLIEVMLDGDLKCESLRQFYGTAVPRVGDMICLFDIQKDGNVDRFVTRVEWVPVLTRAVPSEQYGLQPIIYVK